VKKLLGVMCVLAIASSAFAGLTATVADKTMSTEQSKWVPVHVYNDGPAIENVAGGQFAVYFNLDGQGVPLDDACVNVIDVKDGNLSGVGETILWDVYEDDQGMYAWVLILCDYTPEVTPIVIPSGDSIAFYMLIEGGDASCITTAEMRLQPDEGPPSRWSFIGGMPFYFSDYDPGTWRVFYLD
jgi:hypothetical protein